MILAVYFAFSLVEIILLLPEAETADSQFTSKPSKPSYVLEGQEVTLVWRYALDGIVGSANFFNVTGGGSDLIGKIFSTGNLPIESKYNGRFEAQVSNTQAQLKILRVQRSDQGTYEFSLNPTGAGALKDEVDVIVQSPASFTNVSGHRREPEGTNVVLFCEASGSPKPNITWVKVSQDGSEDQVLQRGPGSTLNLGNISIATAATYNCTAFNGAGFPVIHTVDVTVLFLHEITILSKHYVGRGETAYLHCRVEGYPSPTIKWTPCSLPDVCGKSFLNISNVQTGIANYSCVANNSQGHVSADTSLIIGGNDIYLRLMIIIEKICTPGDQSFWEKLKPEVDKNFEGKNGYTGTELLNFRCGSIIVDLVLRFSTLVAEDFVISTLQNAVKPDGKLGELSINTSSIVGISPVVTSTTASPPSKTTPEPERKNTLVIVLGVLGGILGLVTICGCVICCIRMKKNKESKEVDDKGPRRDQPPGGDRHDGQNNSDYDYAGKPSTLSVPPPKPARQGNDQGVEIPMYAQVDKSKKNPKAPANNYTGGGSPKGREREELQYSTIDHSNQGGSMARGPANQLRRPPAHTETHYAELV